MRSIKHIALALVISAFAATAVLADQAAWITKEQAEKAVALLKDKKQIRHYCNPCKDKGDKVEDIETVDLAKIEDEDYWEVKINGEGVDLAYVYYLDKKGRWKNVATELKIKVTDVPKELKIPVGGSN